MTGAGTAHLWDALREVEDPEWPVSVVDLGLVRAIAVRDRVAHVELTFTSVGCPFVDAIRDSVRTRLEREPGLDAVEVEVTWARWSADDIRAPARRRFAAWGVSL